MGLGVAYGIKNGLEPGWGRGSKPPECGWELLLSQGDVAEIFLQGFPVASYRVDDDGHQAAQYVQHDDRAFNRGVQCAGNTFVAFFLKLYDMRFAVAQIKREGRYASGRTVDDDLGFNRRTAKRYALCAWRKQGSAPGE